MSAVVTVYASQTRGSWSDLERACRDANGLQTHFRFELSPLLPLDELSSTDIAVDDLERRFDAMVPAPAGLVFVDGTFTEHSVDERLPRRVYVSCQSKAGFVTTPLRLFVLYQLASAALSLGELSADANRRMIHEPPIGCLWDWWSGPEQRSIAVITARICPRCQELLRLHLSEADERMAACLQILDYVRRAMLGQSPTVANRIFVAYGAGDDWKVLASMLKGWGLQVEYFNSQPVTAIAVTERWRQMLDRSRFAFTVMTPDVVGTDGLKRSSQNVVHEIGLCHARLGVRNTAILRDESTQSFSNIEGIQQMLFQTGRIRDKEGDIRALLENRGLLEPLST